MYGSEEKKINQILCMKESLILSRGPRGISMLVRSGIVKASV